MTPFSLNRDPFSKPSEPVPTDPHFLWDVRQERGQAQEEEGKWEVEEKERYFEEHKARCEVRAREWKERQARKTAERHVVQVAELKAVTDPEAAVELPPPPPAEQVSRAELGAIPKVLPADHEPAGLSAIDLPLLP